MHKYSVRIKAPNSVNASKRKHKNQINHYDKQRRVLMAISTVCQSKWKPMVEPLDPGRLDPPNIFFAIVHMGEDNFCDFLIASLYDWR